ncbi:MAG: DUF3473 domain-containing protein [Nitrospirae bacterium]|nr:DUF3473 domain-containing protein [Candidatus Manganitrophaceae bacterium]
MTNAITIDVEDYFQVSAFEPYATKKGWDRFESRVEKNTELLLDLLDDLQTQATFFVLGWVAERQPKLVKTIARRGHEVASHGYSHKRIYTQTPEVFKEETLRSKKMLEDMIGQSVQGYRAASYSITAKSLWALDILIEAGFAYDSSIFPVWHDLYGIPDADRFAHVITRDAGTIQEYPLSTLKLGKMNLPVGGGGYLRLFPYPITKWAINHLNKKEKQPAIVYLHPWEVDPEQPRMEGSRLSKFRHYVNLRKTEDTLRKLLREFQFGPMRLLNLAD